MAKNDGIRGNYHFFVILRHIINSPAAGSVGRKRSEKEETDMEISYTYLRSKEVVNLTDGKRLGRVCDVVFRYPENVFLGIVVPGNKGFSFKKGDVFIDVKCISCIGEDVILVRAEGCCRAGKKPRESAAGSAVRAAGGAVHAGRGDARRLRAAFVSARADVCSRAEGGRKKIVRRIRIRKRRYRGLCGKCAVCAEGTRGCAE